MTHSVTSANGRDVTQLEAVLDAIMVDRPSRATRRHKHLCVDAGYAGAPDLKVIEAQAYAPTSKVEGKKPKNSNVRPSTRRDDGS